jgi:polyribonucleotide nucleotidyltransferase
MPDWPLIATVKIDPKKVGMVIGKGGQMIRKLEADHHVEIDIQADGTVLIYAAENTSAKAATSAIRTITDAPPDS